MNELKNCPTGIKRERALKIEKLEQAKATMKYLCKDAASVLYAEDLYLIESLIDVEIAKMQIRENESEIVEALRLAVQWQAFKTFCKTRSECRGCPYQSNHICSFASTEKIMNKVADAAREYLKKEEIPV